MNRVRTAGVAGLALFAVLAGGASACGGGTPTTGNTATQPPASLAATTDTPQELPSSQPPASDLPSTSPSVAFPSPSDTRNIVVPRNVVTLSDATSATPKQFPSRAFARDNGNEYPKQVFLLLRFTNKADGHSASDQLKWGQVSTDEWIDCGDKVYGGNPANHDPAAVWCQKYSMLLTAPGVIIANDGGDTWGVLRQLVFAYAQGELELKNAQDNTPFNPASALCESGRLIRSLHEHGQLNRADTDAWLRSYTDSAEADSAGQVYQGFATSTCN